MEPKLAMAKVFVKDGVAMVAEVVHLEIVRMGHTVVAIQVQQKVSVSFLIAIIMSEAVLPAVVLPPIRIILGVKSRQLQAIIMVHVLELFLVVQVEVMEDSQRPLELLVLLAEEAVDGELLMELHKNNHNEQQKNE